jgi:hypothetical protein
MERDSSNELAPSVAEKEKLKHIGLAFHDSLKSLNPIWVGNVTSPEQHFWLYYLSYHALDQAQERLEDVITKLCPERTLGLDCEEDPEWNQARHYFNLVLPDSEMEMVKHEQRDQRAMLLIKGANIHEPLELKHKASFPDRSSAKAFRNSIEKHGFNIYYHGVGAADRWEVHYKRLATLDDGFFFPLMARLNALVLRHGGKDEGWEG